jgi:hypothetical protein
LLASGFCFRNDNSDFEFLMSSFSFDFPASSFTFGIQQLFLVLRRSLSFIGDHARDRWRQPGIPRRPARLSAFVDFLFSPLHAA